MEDLQNIASAENRGNATVASLGEERQYKDYQRAKRVEEARAEVSKMEYDCMQAYSDKAFLKETCKTANYLGLGAMIVYPAYVKQCVSFLGKDPKVALIAAVSYPHGMDVTEIKVRAVKRAVSDGVDEVEVYAPMPLIKDGNWMYFKRECKKVRKAGKTRSVRIVIDCTQLSEKELIKACACAADAKVACIRLNGAGGQTVSRVKTALKGKCLIKAEKAETASQFLNLCAMGADYVSCVSPCDLADFTLKQAEAEE